MIITAAICGAEVLKEHNPAVPYTVEECVREAKSAYDAGASIIHLHVRYDDGTPTQDKNRFKEVMEAIKAVCPDVIIQPSTGGAVGMTNDERLQPTELFPEMATWIVAPLTSAVMKCSPIRKTRSNISGRK